VLLKNLRHRARLHWNLLNLVWRFDVIAEPAVTVKYWRSIRVGRHCTLQTAAYLYGSRSGRELVLGDYVVVSNACMLLAEGGIAIGDFTHLGPQVVVTTQFGRGHHARHRAWQPLRRRAQRGGIRPLARRCFTRRKPCQATAGAGLNDG
jgi:acetyltransferase-like isoleucine patch superfamily enzyme